MAKVMPYAGKGVAVGKTDRHMLPWIITLSLLTGVAAFTCVRIEILNAQLDYYLPRDFSKDPGKWRSMSGASESGWRRRMAQRDPTIATRPLLPMEQAQMTREVTEARRWNALYDAVSTFGLAQYLLVPVLLLFSLLLFFRSSASAARATACAAFAVSLACGILMVYRGYFTSLGW